MNIFLLCALTLLEIAGPVLADDRSKQGDVLRTVDQVVRRGPYRPDFASLSQHQVADWYRDAKFGIFLHWGVYSVPAWGSEWYAAFMYVEGSEYYNHEISSYGPLGSFGYKDFIPMFQATSFDPDDWVTLFKRAGAKFVVPVSEHHDGFSMWNNPMNSYNSVNMGPHRDTTGTGRCRPQTRLGFWLFEPSCNALVVLPKRPARSEFGCSESGVCGFIRAGHAVGDPTRH